ncbi:Nuclear fusion protein KAR5 [Pleurostoma richardsiae]|uniref:Nuclear fusion protein KAR5 n=1 Tax=Pleurostoma richardsiae TaxID=41990 RepID=A0AA38RBP6_9PEZI|nr:Nuclear fusion protein KAR5 [Pleurostoma richardsiae]
MSPSDILKARTKLPNIYAAALNELQALESEPLCHRVAARLLVNNCQLLEGKDEATVLTDSGRHIRDFVDSYAASLAICDLERGAFEIPSACSKFREPALVQLQIQDEPRLHVTSGEIDICLSGLAQSNSAWTTWVSYRHKALRFCEAARVDQEKTQNILLYQRLTKAMAKLADGVEADLQAQLAKQKQVEDQMEYLHIRSLETGQLLDQLGPRIDEIKAGLAGLEDYLSTDLNHAMQSSTDSINAGHESATNLRQFLDVLMNTVLESNSRVAAAHEQSLERVSRKASDEMDVVVTAMAYAVASSVSLQNQIESSQNQAAQLALRQSSLENGMTRLLTISERLSSKYKDHTYRLNEATNMTNSLLQKLEKAASSAASFGMGKSKWWPHIVCPVTTLLLGSYGLPPSLLRNFLLLCLGELVGLAVSSVDGLATVAPFFFTSSSFVNGTTALSLM